MRGGFYIDGMDIFREFGMYPVKDAYAELLALPKVKAYKLIDWQEHDGIDADLTEGLFKDKKVVKLSFAIRNSRRNFPLFLQLLESKQYHKVKIEELGQSFNLRYVSYSDLNLSKDLGFVSVNFSEDKPMSMKLKSEALAGGLFGRNDAFAINGVALSSYGIAVLQGTLKEITKSHKVKEAQSVTISGEYGIEYDTKAPIRYKAKEVKIYCLMKTSRIEDFWQNMSALSKVLFAGENYLSVKVLDKTFPFIYSSCKVTSYDISDVVRCQFVLTLTFNRDFRF